MTSLAPAPQPVMQTPAGSDDDFDHIYCCDEFRALCGADLHNAEEVEDFDDPCPMCEVIEASGMVCAFCGEA